MVWLWGKNDPNKNTISSGEYEELLKRIIKLNGEIETLKAYLEAYKLQLDNLRGNFSRKLKAMAEEEKGAEKEEESKNESFNNNGYVAFG